MAHGVFAVWMGVNLPEAAEPHGEDAMCHPEMRTRPERTIIQRCAVAARRACNDSMRFIVASSSFCQVAIGASCEGSSDRSGRRQIGHAGGTSGLALNVTFRPQDTQQRVIGIPGAIDQGRRTDAASGGTNDLIGRSRITRT